MFITVRMESVHNYEQRQPVHAQRFPAPGWDTFDRARRCVPFVGDELVSFGSRCCTV